VECFCNHWCSLFGHARLASRQFQSGQSLDGGRSRKARVARRAGIFCWNVIIFVSGITIIVLVGCVWLRQQHILTIFHNAFDVTLDEIGFCPVLFLVTKQSQTTSCAIDTDGFVSIHNGTSFGFGREASSMIVAELITKPCPRRSKGRSDCRSAQQEGKHAEVGTFHILYRSCQLPASSFLSSLSHSSRLSPRCPILNLPRRENIIGSPGVSQTPPIFHKIDEGSFLEDESSGGQQVCA